MAAAATNVVVDPFCFRQFNDKENSTYLGDKAEVATFEARLDAMFKDFELVDGYAPFCKHIFIPNILEDDVHAPVCAITDANQHLMRSAYESRTPEELPVMVRWFPTGAVETQRAKFLDIILYSAAQICEENKAMGKADATVSAVPWGVVSIKPQHVEHELPMQPITMMRNALGKDQGGSGVTLQRAKYNESVAYWREHATVASKASD